MAAVATSLNDQEIPEGYIVLHSSTVLVKDGCQRMPECPYQGKGCQGKDLSIQRKDDDIPDSRKDAFRVETGINNGPVASNNHVLLDLYGLPKVKMNAASTETNLSNSPFRESFYKVIGTADHLRDDSSRKSVQPLHQHLLCEKCLMEEVNGLRSIRCKSCNKLISPRCVVNYIKKIALQGASSDISRGNLQGTISNIARGCLVRDLLENFLNVFGTNAFLFLLDIKCPKALRRFRDYCDSLQSPVSHDASTRRKAKDNDIVTQQSIVHDIIDRRTIASLIEKIEEIAGCMEQTAGGTDDQVPQKKLRLAQPTTTTATIGELYMMSLNFGDFPLQNANIENIDAFLSYGSSSGSGNSMGYAEKCFSYAKALFLLDRTSGTGAITAQKMLMGEASKKQKGSSGNFIQDYISQSMISVTDLLELIIQNIKCCDFRNPSDRMTALLNKIVSELTLKYSTHCLAPLKCSTNSMVLDDLLRIEALIQAYPTSNPVLESLKRLREDYTRETTPITVIQMLMRGMKRMWKAGRFIPLDGAFAIFAHSKMTEMRSEFFKEFYAGLPDRDMQIYYFPELVKYNIICINKLTMNCRGFPPCLRQHDKNSPNLKYTYAKGLLLYAIRKLETLLASPEPNKPKILISKLGSFLINLQKWISTKGKTLKPYLNKTGGASPKGMVFDADFYIAHTIDSAEVKLICGMACYYNSIIRTIFSESQSNAIQQFAIDMAFLTPYDYIQILQWLCDARIYNLFPLYRDLLDRVIPNVYSSLSEKNIVTLYKYYLDDEPYYCEILVKAALEFNINVKRRIKGNNVPEYNNALVESYIDSMIEQNGDDRRKAELNSLRIIKDEFHAIIEFLARNGYDVKRNRALFYNKIYPLLAFTLAKYADPLFKDTPEMYSNGFDEQGLTREYDINTLRRLSLLNTLLASNTSLTKGCASSQQESSDQAKEIKEFISRLMIRESGAISED